MIEVSEYPCAVLDCPNEGRLQVCPFDGRYHRHGLIHNTNDYDYPERLGMTFRDLSVAGWERICNEHYAQIEERLPSRRLSYVFR